MTRILCTILGASAQQGHPTIGDVAGKGSQDDQRTGALALQDEVTTPGENAAEQ